MRHFCASPKTWFSTGAGLRAWAGLAGLLGILGCSTPDFQESAVGSAAEKAEPILIREGDMLRITFPGAPNLNTLPLMVRRDGKITLPLVGEVTAAGKTALGFQQELTNLFSSQLVMKDVNVNIESAVFTVYVTGAVLRPGKVDTIRPITALEAIMEAGGFDYSKANLKEVTVTRTTQGHVDHYKLNLKRVLDGKDSQTFYLKPADIVFVPERLTWF